MFAGERASAFGAGAGEGDQSQRAHRQKGLRPVGAGGVHRDRPR